MDGTRTIPAERYAERLAACRRVMAGRTLAGLMIGVGPDLRYMAGFVGEPMERLTLLVVPREGPVSFLVPRLEAEKAEATPLVSGGLAEVVAFEETENAAARAAELLMADRRAAGAGAVGLSDRLWAMHVLALQAALPGRPIERASAVMGELRQVKDEDEKRLLGLAAAAADRALQAVVNGPLVGRSEAEVSREIRGRLLDEGHDTADFAIVGSGPNGASPHHEAGERVIEAGEPVVLDIGGTLAGYASDTTRTVWVAGDRAIDPEPEFVRAYEVVRRAQAQATAAVRPGVPAEAVDAVARGVIATAGYGEYFTHRLGHGIGLEVHEDPYMVAGNTTPLAPGMAFSVEPGVYLPGRWGIRLENIVMCAPEPEGSTVLNHSPLELRVVRGQAG